MTDRSRSAASSSDYDLPRHRSHSHRGKSARTANDLHRQKLERIQRRFEEQLDESERELQWARNLRNESFSSPIEYLHNVRAKLRNGYNQLMQQKVEEVEDYMNQRRDKERRLVERKFRDDPRKAQIANEKFHLQSMNEVIHEREAVCEEKLAAQRSLYNHLLDEQARRFQAEKYLQSFESLNVDQLKDRLTCVENSNQELKQMIRFLLYGRQPPLYRSVVHIPNFRT